jgi:hypothetical protein
MAKGEMEIVIKFASDVAGWYLATLRERGHEAMIVDGHHPRRSTTWLEREWRNLTDIPR